MNKTEFFLLFLVDAVILMQVIETQFVQIRIKYGSFCVSIL